MVERRESDRTVRAVRYSMWLIGLAKTGEAGERREAPARELGGETCPERSEGAGGREGGRLASLIDPHRFVSRLPAGPCPPGSAAEAATRPTVAEATYCSALFRPVRLVRLPARPPSTYPHFPHPHCAHVIQPELRMTGPEHSGQTLTL